MIKRNCRPINRMDHDTESLTDLIVAHCNRPRWAHHQSHSLLPTPIHVCPLYLPHLTSTTHPRMNNSECVPNIIVVDFWEQNVVNKWQQFRALFATTTDIVNGQTLHYSTLYLCSIKHEWIAIRVRPPTQLIIVHMTIMLQTEWLYLFVII